MWILFVLEMVAGELEREETKRHHASTWLHVPPQHTTVNALTTATADECMHAYTPDSSRE
jgi:hypothetical protein